MFQNDGLFDMVVKNEVLLVEKGEQMVKIANGFETFIFHDDDDGKSGRSFVAE